MLEFRFALFFTEKFGYLGGPRCPLLSLQAQLLVIWILEGREFRYLEASWDGQKLRDWGYMRGLVDENHSGECLLVSEILTIVGTDMCEARRVKRIHESALPLILEKARYNDGDKAENPSGGDGGNDDNYNVIFVLTRSNNL